MNQGSDWLRGRREALIRRSNGLRLDCGSHVHEIEAALQRVDRGLSLVHRIATPRVLFAGSLLAVLLLGRMRSWRTLAAGLALAGQLAIQLVRRSR